MTPNPLVGLGVWTPPGVTRCNYSLRPERCSCERLGETDAEQAAKAGLTSAGWTFLIAAIFIVPAAAWVLWKEHREAAG